MERDHAEDQAIFEEALSEMFGEDMTGWTRISTSFDRDSDQSGEVTRLVFAVDAEGQPLPPAGERAEGYTLGGVVIASIDHIDFGGTHPQVQINVWNPLNNRLVETGHSTPSVGEVDRITGGAANWIEDPLLVEQVLAEFETNLPDAVADALGQLELDGGLASVPVEAEDLWEDSRGFTDASDTSQGSPQTPTDDLPPGVTETTPWIPDGVHETVPWDPSTDDATPQASSKPPSEWEAWPGQAAYLKALDEAGPPTESGPIDDIDGMPIPPSPSPPEKRGVGTAVKVAVGAVALVTVVAGGLFAVSSTNDAAVASPTTSQPQTSGTGDDPAASETTPSTNGSTAQGEAPQLDAQDDVLDDELFDIPIPERTPASLDAPTHDGFTATEILLLPAPDATTSDDVERAGGGSLYVDAVYVVDWQADIVVDNAVITPGYLFPPGSGWNGEYLILAECAGGACVYSTPLANGDTLTFSERGRTLFGSVTDTSGGCVRDIFIAFKVSDFQTINGRLVPDAIQGARVETGICQSAVYREITYEGGFQFVGSYNDQ